MDIREGQDQVQHIPQTPTLVKESNKSSNISL